MSDSYEVFDFPCRFPIKAMGLAQEDIQILLLSVLKTHGATPHPDDIVSRRSGGGKYISITATIRATSRAQLEAIYTELRQDQRIRYLL